MSASLDALDGHLNLYGHYRLSSRMSVSGRFRAATNTPLVGYIQEVSGRYFPSDVRNQTRLPFYSRLQARAVRVERYVYCLS